MKYWIIISIFLLGSVLTIIGGLLGMDGETGASWLLNISLALQVIAVILLVLKLIKGRNANGLNK